MDGDVPLSVMMGTRGSAPTVSSRYQHVLEHVGAFKDGHGNKTRSTTDIVEEHSIVKQANEALPPVDYANIADTLAWLSQGTTVASESGAEVSAKETVESRTRGSALAFEVSSSQEAALLTVRRFFSQVVPAEIRSGTEANQLEVDAFVDYTQLSMTLHVETIGQNPVVTMSQATQCDIILFHKLFGQLQAAVVSETGCTDASAPIDDDFDDFDDFDFSAAVDQETWPERIASAMQAVSARSSAYREDTFRILARWAELDACKVELAQALSSKQEILKEVLQATSLCPLAELYPLAATIKSLSLCPKASLILQEAFGKALQEASADSNLPRLVYREFYEATSNMLRFSM